MDALLLALILNLLLDQGSGTQRVVARLGDRGEVPTGIVASLTLIVGVNAVIGAVLGALVAAWLIPDARLLFLAMALAMGGLGLMIAALRPSPRKDVRITGPGALLRFLIRRAGENAAFATAGVAAFTAAPAFTAIGGMVGGWAALILPLSMGSSGLDHGAMRAARIVCGVILVSAAIGCAASALHLL